MDGEPTIVHGGRCAPWRWPRSSSRSAVSAGRRAGDARARSTTGGRRVIWTVIGALLLWQLVPRPARPSSQAVPVRADDAPASAPSRRRGGRRHRGPTTRLRRRRHGVRDVAGPGRATSVARPSWWGCRSGPPSTATSASPCLAHELACVEPASGACRHPGPARRRPAHPAGARAVRRPASCSRTRPLASSPTAGWVVLGAGDDLAGDRIRREVATSVGAAGLSVVAAPAAASGDAAPGRAAGRHPGVPRGGPPCRRSRRLPGRRADCCSARCRCRGRGWPPRSPPDGGRPVRGHGRGRAPGARRSSRDGWRRPPRTGERTAHTTRRRRPASRPWAAATWS